MITEDYVSFGTAKLLKEKGFDCEWVSEFGGYYVDSYHNGQDIGIATESGMLNKTLEDWEYLRPTLQMAMKWLREAHNKIIVPGISLDDRTSSTINHYIVGIWYIPKNNGGAFCYTLPTPYNGYPSFEEACEEAIKYCLENLI